MREAEGFGLVLTRDLIGSALGYRAAGAKSWLERCRLVIADLGNPSKDQAALDAALRSAEALAADADRLSCNVTKDLERLKVRLLLSTSSCNTAPAPCMRGRFLVEIGTPCREQSVSSTCVF